VVVALAVAGFLIVGDRLSWLTTDLLTCSHRD
jgi:hypothetical protein